MSTKKIPRLSKKYIRPPERGGRGLVNATATPLEGLRDICVLKPIKKPKDSEATPGRVPTGGYPKIDNPMTAMEECRPFKIRAGITIIIDSCIEDKQSDLIVFRGHSAEGQKLAGNCYLRGEGFLSLHCGD